jgi:hypothetical protein
MIYTIHQDKLELRQTSLEMESFKFFHTILMLVFLRGFQLHMDV